MINYSKVRESVEKTASKKSLGRSINKSHTSSINIKLGQADYLRGNLREKAELCLGKAELCLGKGFSQKKCSVKLQSNEKENFNRRRENAPYDVTLFRPFQETNRYLQTERLPKQGKTHTPTKQPLRLRTDHQDQQLRTDYTQESQLRTEYGECTPEKSEKGRREASTKHATEASTRMVRVAVEDLRRLVAELAAEQSEVEGLRRELRFYREQAGKGSGNSVLRALRV